MATTIAFANQKGGVGKTTMSFNFAAILASRGYDVLLVDLDSQANLTKYCGIQDPNKLPYTVGHAMMEIMDEGELDRERFRLFRNERYPNLRILGANNDLYNVKQYVMNTMSRETVLKRALEVLDGSMDYIVIDCAPSLDIDLINAMVAADEVIIVSTPTPFSYDGSQQLMKTIFKVKKLFNPQLEIAGVVCNMVDRRNNFTPAMISEMKQNWEANGIVKIFHTEVPRSIRVDESQCEKVPMTIYEENNKVTKACTDLVDEYLGLSEKEETDGEKEV